MGVRETVFGSKEERRYFTKLQEAWGSKYHIYHNLPFLNVLKGKGALVDDSGNQFCLSDEEFDQLKKVSIDFTVCDKSDAPLVCIEFDGLQGGFNVGTEYRTRDGAYDRKGRRALLELKLRVAHGSLFPLFILCSDQFRGLSDAVRLTIADGLIGEVMAGRAKYERIHSGFDPTEYGMSQEEFDHLSPIQQTEIIEDWVIGIEVESDYAHNPIFTKVAELSERLGVTGYRTTFLNDEDRDPDEWVWVESGVEGPGGVSASAKLCLPNFRTPFCFFTVHIAEEIARLLALEKLRKQTTRRGRLRGSPQRNKG